MFSHRVAQRLPVIITSAVFAACAVVVNVPLLSAQGAADTSVRARMPRIGGQPGDIRKGEKRDGENRRELEAKFQARADDFLRKRLQLSDAQIVKLRDHNKRFDIDRRAIFTEEEGFRKALRAELMPGITPNEAKVAELLDKWPAMERKKLALQERELKELSSFLQPIQRARFFAFQDEIRRSKQETQWGRPGMPGMPGMRPDSLGGRGQFRGDSLGRGGYRGGGPGGRGYRPPPRDTIKK